MIEGIVMKEQVEVLKISYLRVDGFGKINLSKKNFGISSDFFNVNYINRIDKEIMNGKVNVYS